MESNKIDDAKENQDIPEIPVSIVSETEAVSEKEAVSEVSKLTDTTPVMTPMTEAVSTVPTVSTMIEKPTAKRRGRPPGAKSKSKPKAKQKDKEEIPEIAPPEEEPRSASINPPQQSIRESIPDLATEMFKLLALQRESKRMEKSRLYASWFK